MFLAGVVCLAAWQVWLTLRLIEQDRNLEFQRAVQRLVQISGLAVAQLAERLDDWDLGLRELNSLPPPTSLEARMPTGSTFVMLFQNSVQVFPSRPLLFTPIAPVVKAQSSQAFDAIDELELREQQFDPAMAALQPLAREPATRPEALLRIARIENKTNRKKAALETYRLLTGETALNSSGTPYPLLASTARCRLLQELGRQREAADEATKLRNALLEGRWPLGRDTFALYWSELDRLGISAGSPPRSSMDFSVLVSDLYDQWQSAHAPGSRASGRRTLQDSSLLLWNSTPDHLSALITTPDWLNSSLKLPADANDIQWKFLRTGANDTLGLDATRLLAETELPLASMHLPGRIEFVSLMPTSNPASSRYGLWLVGVALMLLVVLGSGYVLHRAIGRELQVAKLQSDFVAAVSHEFRSPLTTLRTITELLAQDRITDESRRKQSYVFLDRETGRLHRLVEDLLDFGRMESGRKQYKIEKHDAFQVVRAAVSDVGEHAVASGFNLEVSLDSAPASIRADEEALRRAVRNLVENAMKYSPECRTVWIDGVVIGRKVSISVHDNGMGIDPAEQRAIFQKFVRGNAAKSAGIKGTGIGLAMVRQTSEAMGGEIRLQSQVGVGSTFTLELPLADD
jgi:signal transduction histidine kinase